MIRIVLADDHSMVRMGFKMLIMQQKDFEVVGEASDPNEAFELVKQLSPEVLLTDVSMGTEKSGLLLVKRLYDVGISTNSVVLTMHNEQEYLSQALKSGAVGYLLKSSSDEELFKAIRQAAAGEIFICNEMLQGFVHNALSHVDPAAESLTPRESEIVSLAVKGYSNQEIAQMLAISVKTVEGQKSKIMHKLAIETKPELFDYAVRHGLVKI
ncbi:MAG: response regulator transcription factor [Eggerthellaceae bacterium]|nr:response regulator transcription factor [Eggerthellaceae bacterium]MEE0343548.1 response regulator transcription factor [Eggerthellaceae bacterium]